MDRRAIEQYLHEHIPLSGAMGVRVRTAEPDQVILEAPLAPNINHRETVFGGSASAVAILSAWTLLYVRLQDAGLDGRVVIQSNTMSYDKPLPGDFTARATAPEPAAWERLVQALRRNRPARIKVDAQLLTGDILAGRLAGVFVVLPPG